MPIPHQLSNHCRCLHLLNNCLLRRKYNHFCNFFSRCQQHLVIILAVHLSSVRDQVVSWKYDHTFPDISLAYRTLNVLSLVHFDHVFILKGHRNFFLQNFSLPGPGAAKLASNSPMLCFVKCKIVHKIPCLFSWNLTIDMKYGLFLEDWAPSGVWFSHWPLDDKSKQSNKKETCQICRDQARLFSGSHLVAVETVLKIRWSILNR